MSPTTGSPLTFFSTIRFNALRKESCGLTVMGVLHMTSFTVISFKHPWGGAASERDMMMLLAGAVTAGRFRQKMEPGKRLR